MREGRRWPTLSFTTRPREEVNSEGEEEEEEKLPSMKAPLNRRMRGRMARRVLAPLVRAVRVLVRVVRSDLSCRLTSITGVQT